MQKGQRRSLAKVHLGNPGWNWGGSRNWSNQKPTQVRQVTNAWWQNMGV